MFTVPQLNNYELYCHIWVYVTCSARNGNLEVLLYFLKAKQGYTVRKMGKDKCRYGILAHFEHWLQVLFYVVTKIIYMYREREHCIIT
jgi:hypothetical protein